MKFGKVPEIVEQARPWAKTLEIGPPIGRENEIGSLNCQVEEHPQWGHMFRFYLELEPGDLEKIQQGNPIEFSVLAQQMVPVSVQVW